MPSKLFVYFVKMTAYKGDYKENPYRFMRAWKLPVPEPIPVPPDHLMAQIPAPRGGVRGARGGVGARGGRRPPQRARGARGARGAGRGAARGAARGAVPRRQVPRAREDIGGEDDDGGGEPHEGGGDINPNVWFYDPVTPETHAYVKKARFFINK